MRKKLPSRIAFILFSFMLSLAACGYLNHPSRLGLGLSTSLEQVGHFENMEDAPATKNPLPEMHLLKKLVEAARHLIPVQ